MKVSGTLLYPRLTDGIALEQIATWKSLTLPELRRKGSIYHPSAAPAATGGHAATAEDVEQVQDAVRQILDMCGFPEQPTGGQAQAFDQACGNALVEAMGIVPADAGARGVWTFMTVIVVPEVVPWRFPDAPVERYLGDRRRNVLRRLWWRSWTLGAQPDIPVGCTAIGEDELVQIMERPSLSGDRRTARALQEAVWRIEQAYPRLPRSRVFRQVCLHVLASRSHTLLAALTDEELRGLIDGAIKTSVAQLDL